MRSLRCFAVVVALVACPALASELAPASTPALEVTAHIPTDPLFVWAVKTESAAAELDAVLGLLAEMTPTEDGFDAEAILEKIDAKLGVSLRSDLLARLGPELAFVIDLPPFDTVAGLMANLTPEALDRALGRVGFVAQVREPDAFAAALRTALETSHAVVTANEAGWTAEFPDPAAKKGEPKPALHWRIVDGWLAMGIAPSWAWEAVPQRPAGTDLRAGADFKRVAAHLDQRPISLLYLNLPKLAAMLRDSGFVQGMAASNPESKAALDVWLKGDRLGIGWGSTSLAVDGGVRTTGFGPELLSGRYFAGIVAAIAIPNLLNAIDRGRTKRTMADMRSLATSIEAYAVDNNHYPQTQGWATAEALAAVVAPTYIKTVPAADAWEHPFKVFSNGQDYVIVSAGPNGVVDHDWTPPIDGSIGPQATDDIVFTDGTFLSDMEEAEHPE